MKPSDTSRFMVGSIVLLLGLLWTDTTVAAFDGSRVYWPLPKNTNIIGVHSLSGVANASWSNWSRIQPNIDIESDIKMLSYTRVQPILGRTVYWQGILPAGTTNTSSILPVDTNDTFVNGLGDPTLGATINLFGAPGMKAKEWFRHELDLSVNLGLSITLPLGQYDDDETLNIGSNQWKTRLSLPIIKSFGDWVPGQRTTLEIMPTVLLFGDNDEAQGNRLEQDALHSIELHLTRDFSKHAYISLDYTWLEGAEETLIDKTTGLTTRETGGIDADLLGVTIGFDINDNLRLFLTHMQTMSEQRGNLALEGSLTKVSMTWSWHDVLEKVREFGKQ